MQIGDEVLDVKYVTAFTRVGSVDEVTAPARGGRFLAALVESAAGATTTKKEKPMKLIERLKAAQTALLEASKDKDISEANKKKLTESNVHLEKLLAEATKAAEEAEAEAKKGDDGEEEEADDANAHGGVKPGHKVTKTTTIKHDGPVDDGDGEDEDEDEQEEEKEDEGKKGEESEAQESKRGYLRALLKEAGVPKKLWGLDKLCKLSIKEAKMEIEEKLALIETIRESLDETPVGFGAPLSEADGGGEAASNNSLFSGCAS